MWNNYALWFVVLFLIFFVIFWFSKPWYVQSIPIGQDAPQVNPLWVLLAAFILATFVALIIKLFMKSGYYTRYRNQPVVVIEK